jgi:PAS domain S-box-containing protein
MTDRDDIKKKASDLRRRAEESLLKKSSIQKDLSALAREDVERLVHELSVHQIELEMQNAELQEAQNLLSESRDRFSDLYDYAPVGYFTLGTDGLIMEVNLTGAGLLAADRSSLIGKPFQRFLVEGYAGSFYLHEREVFKAGTRQKCEIKLRKSDGGTFDAQMESLAMKDGDGRVTRCLTIVSDITERKQAEEKVREQIDFMETLFDTIPNPIFHKDANGRYTGCNRAFLEFTGKPMEEILGKTVYEMGAEDIAARYAERDRELFEHPGKQHYEWRVQNTLGEVREVIFDKATLLDTHGAITGLIGVISDITERRRAEEAVRIANHFLESIIEHAAEGLCVCHNVSTYPFVRFTVWNQRMQEITGYSMEQINSLGWYQTVYPDPEVQTRACERMTRMGDGEDLVDEEWEITRSDGRKCVLRITTTILRSFDGQTDVLALMHDITERKRAEERLGEAEKRYRTLFEGANDAIFIMNPDGFIECNRTTLKIFGCEQLADVVGHTAWDFSPLRQPDGRDSKDKALELINDALEGRPQRFYWQYIRKDQTPFDAEVSLNSVMLENRMLVQALVRDITERKRLHEQLVRAEGLKTINEVSCRLAHEIRNPLVSAGGFARLLLSSMNPDDPNRAKVNIIIKEVARLEAILRMTLNYLQPLELNLLSADLNDLVESTLERLHGYFARHHVDLDVQLAPALPVFEGDPVLFSQVLETLITNALTQIQEGSTLRIHTWQEATRLGLMMHYPATHLSADDAEHFFYPFTTSGATFNAMDLPMCKIIVNKHGGTIKVDREESMELAIHISLPLHSDQ